MNCSKSVNRPMAIMTSSQNCITPIENRNHEALHNLVLYKIEEVFLECFVSRISLGWGIFIHFTRTITSWWIFSQNSISLLKASEARSGGSRYWKLGIWSPNYFCLSFQVWRWDPSGGERGVNHDLTRASPPPSTNPHPDTSGDTVSHWELISLINLIFTGK